MTDVIVNVQDQTYIVESVQKKDKLPVLTVSHLDGKDRKEIHTIEIPCELSIMQMNIVGRFYGNGHYAKNFAKKSEKKARTILAHL